MDMVPTKAYREQEYRGVTGVIAKSQLPPLTLSILQLKFVDKVSNTVVFLHS